MFNRLTNPGRNRLNKAIVPRKYRGDTMIEVLVTVLILAVGVLGVAAMQVTTYQNLNISHSASIAAIVAEDFSERMRANMDATTSVSGGKQWVLLYRSAEGRWRVLVVPIPLP